MPTIDFLAIGDTVVDDFIRLKDASVHCNIDNEDCTITMRWGDKIPFESSTILAGVGNSANAAVSAARLGLSSALMATIGDDADGRLITEYFEKEGLSRDYITEAPGKHTNHHYVLWYESERTILVKPEPYDYTFPMDLEAPKTIYLSSLGEAGEAYYADMATYLNQHPDIFLTFQPGTFQMKMGKEKLAPLLTRTNLFIVNKEESKRILGTGFESAEIPELLKALHALGPATIVMTDGRNGAFAYDGTQMLTVPMYPDDRPPFERTGAGDAFASTVTSALTLGKPLEEALLWGPINSMSVVQEIGAQKGLLSREALIAYLEKAPESYTTTPLV